MLSGTAGAAVAPPSSAVAAGAAPGASTGAVGFRMQPRSAASVPQLPLCRLVQKSQTRRTLLRGWIPSMTPQLLLSPLVHLRTSHRLVPQECKSALSTGQNNSFTAVGAACSVLQLLTCSLC